LIISLFYVRPAGRRELRTENDIVDRISLVLQFTALRYLNKNSGIWISILSLLAAGREAMWLLFGPASWD
jgi:hypothetical protein